MGVLLLTLVIIAWASSYVALERLRKRLALRGTWRLLPALPVIAPVVVAMAVAPFTITQNYVLLQWVFVLSLLLSICLAMTLLAFRKWPDFIPPEVFD